MKETQEWEAGASATNLDVGIDMVSLTVICNRKDYDCMMSLKL